MLHNDTHNTQQCSGEDNRKRAFRRLFALVRALPMKPLGLEGTGFGSGSSAAKSQATKPNTIEGDLIQSSESPRSVIQPNEAPSNRSDPSDVHSCPAEFGPIIVHEPPPTHAELMELFDTVEALYSALAAPEDSPTLPDDIIADAFVLGGKIVWVSKSAGSRQDVLANVGAENNRVHGAEPEHRENSISRMASVAFESEIETSKAEPSTAQGNTSEAQSSVAAPEGVPPVEARPDTLHPVPIAVAETVNIPAPFIVPDVIVTSYEDGTEVAIMTSGRKSRKAGLDRKLLFAHHTYHAPRTEKTTRAPSEFGPLSDPGSVSTSTPEGQSSGDMAGPLESDNVDHSGTKSNLFEYDHFLNDSSNAQTSVANPDDSDDEDEHDVESDPQFGYDLILELVEAESREPELEPSSLASSPESTPLATPTSMDLPLSTPPPLDLTDRSSRPIDLETSWAWNAMDEVNDDRDGAIGTAL
ncbi:hypothetical protein FRC08_009942 [Ceratobasidium sp. 394]|nr:hypothetical protein FRC08_009942 [Ceratobasidium sp. 394]